jgi:hypothetical protein
MREIKYHWNIQEESKRDIGFKILVDVLRLSIEKVETPDLNKTDRKGCHLVHKALKNISRVDPEWSINDSVRKVQCTKE